jgi:MscS family membrane protein
MRVPAFRIAACVSHALLAWALLGAEPAAAQTEPAAPAPSAAEPAPQLPQGPEDPYDRGTPRGAMVGFLETARSGDWERAVEFLDLRSIPSDERATRGPELARRLKLVLDRALWIDVEALSVEPAGATGDGLARRDVAGRIDATSPPTPVYLERVARDDGVRIWKIAAPTLAEVPALWEQFGDSPLLERLPEPLREIGFLEIRLWQWLALLAAAAAAVIAGAFFALLAARALRPLLQRVTALHVAVTPLAALGAIAAFSAAQRAIKLAVPAQRVLDGALQASAVLAATWLALRVVDAAELRLAERLRLHGRPAGKAVIVLARRGAKAVIASIALLVALQSFGVDVTALVAGLGVGGIAVALAAQRSLENLFGGLTIVADQPARVGDFCRFGDTIGTVEDVGLRSTRVRTLERTVVTVPNAELASMAIENFARRDVFWYRPKLGLRYETTPDQLRWLLVAAREILYAHPRVDPNPARVRFIGFGSSSLDLEIFAYVRAADFDDFLEVAEDLNLRLMDVVARAGTSFAFPSQTVYVRPDEGLDAENAERVQGEVARWRKRGEMALPAFPAERVQHLAGTLDYPPEGSAVRLAAR